MSFIVTIPFMIRHFLFQILGIRTDVAYLYLWVFNLNISESDHLLKIGIHILIYKYHCHTNQQI